MPKEGRFDSYPFYFQDWRSSARVGSLTAIQKCIYRELIDYYWELGSLPNDEEVMFKWCRVGRREWSSGRSVITTFFTLENDGRLHSEDLDEKRNKVLEIKKRKQVAANGTNAKRGAERKFGNDAPSTLLRRSYDTPTTPRRRADDAPTTRNRHENDTAFAVSPLESVKDATLSVRTQDGERDGERRSVENSKTDTPTTPRRRADDAPTTRNRHENDTAFAVSPLESVKDATLSVRSRARSPTPTPITPLTPHETEDRLKPLPMEMFESEPAYWAERWYNRHPKKNRLFESEEQVRRLMLKVDMQKILEIEQCHAAHCESKKWREEPHFVSPLDKWLFNREYDSWPAGHVKPKPHSETYERDMEYLEWLRKQPKGVPSNLADSDPVPWKRKIAYNYINHPQWEPK